MDKLHGFLKSRVTGASLVFVGVLAVSLVGVRFSPLVSAQAGDSSQSDDNLIADFRRVEVASVSDALEQLTGKRMYMSHRMHPIFTTKFAGFARTVLLKKDEGNTDPAALNGMLEAIDDGSTNSVYVMVVENGEDIAGMGGLMGTAMSARGYAGAVIDGGVRDAASPFTPPASFRRPRCTTTNSEDRKFRFLAMAWWSMPAISSRQTAMAL
jgi:hypothetical protein